MARNVPDPSTHRQNEESEPRVTLTVGLTPCFKRLLEAKAKRSRLTLSELIGRILRADVDGESK